MRMKGAVLMEAAFVGVCRRLSAFVGVCRHLSAFVGSCRRQRGQPFLPTEIGLKSQFCHRSLQAQQSTPPPFTARCKLNSQHLLVSALAGSSSQHLPHSPITANSTPPCSIAHCKYNTSPYHRLRSDALDKFPLVMLLIRKNRTQLDEYTHMHISIFKKLIHLWGRS